MTRHDLPAVSSILTFFKLGLLVCTWKKSNSTSIGSFRRLCLLCIAVTNNIGCFNSNASSRELTFPRKVFYLCEKNCGTHSSYFECLNWFSEKNIQHRVNTKSVILRREQHLSVCPKY